MTEYQRVMHLHCIRQAVHCAATWRAFATPGHWGNGIRTPEECERLAKVQEANAAHWQHLLDMEGTP